MRAGAVGLQEIARVRLRACKAWLDQRFLSGSSGCEHSGNDGRRRRMKRACGRDAIPDVRACGMRTVCLRPGACHAPGTRLFALVTAYYTLWCCGVASRCGVIATTWPDLWRLASSQQGGQALSSLRAVYYTAMVRVTAAPRCVASSSQCTSWCQMTRCYSTIVDCKPTQQLEYGALWLQFQQALTSGCRAQFQRSRLFVDGALACLLSLFPFFPSGPCGPVLFLSLFYCLSSLRGGMSGITPSDPPGQRRLSYK
eukprot:356266-Chlamydomonas_euryale.AAC.4